MTIPVKERGWPAHFCMGDRCLFRRNTLVGEYPKCIIVSTVGNLYESGIHSDGPQTVGAGRYYETAMFKPDMAGEYIDIDPSEEIPFEGKKAIAAMHDSVDNEANDMHDAAVKIAVEMLEVQK